MIARLAACLIWGHQWTATSSNVLGGKVPARCARCGRHGFVYATR